MYNSLTPMKLIRYLVAFVFITSALMKVISSELGNVFIHLGLPYPLQVMYLVAIVEIGCGILLIMNRYVRNASIALMVIIIAAILMTKVPSLHMGVIQTLFHARLDVVMFGLLFILYSQSPRI